MKLLYILSAFFISCSTEPEDCAGVEGGNAYLDDYGLCTGGTIDRSSECEWWEFWCN